MHENSREELSSVYSEVDVLCSIPSKNGYLSSKEFS